MKKRLVALAVTLAAAVVFKLWPQADAATEMPAPPPAPVVVATPEIEPIQSDLPMPDIHSLGRNLFGYREPPPAPAPVHVVSIAPPIVAPAPIVAPPTSREPQLPTFRYRYIGRFGPDSAPIAVFRGDDAIINATIGQVIDSTFVVRAIGLESVSLALAADAGRGEVRVRMGE